MNVAVFLYVMLFFVIWWGYEGYIVYLAANRKKVAFPSSAQKEFSFSIIVPTFNEKEFVTKKIESLKRLAYPQFEVICVDASTDETPALIQAAIKDDQRFSLLASAKRGRSHQINTALERAKGEVIVISDCDGLIPADTLEKLALRFQDDGVGVVGACVLPHDGSMLDRAYWASQNAVRFLESEYGHCPSVTGVCYGFRRSILGSLPGGIWSDDVYVPLLANTKGFLSLYTPECVAFELRTPKDLRSFIAHKERKAQDYIKELLRFLPRVAAMRMRWAIVYISRCIQLLLLPWAVLAGGVLWFYQVRTVQVVSIGVFALVGLIPWYILKKRGNRDTPVPFLPSLIALAVTNGVLISALVHLAMHKGKIIYAKVKE